MARSATRPTNTFDSRRDQSEVSTRVLTIGRWQQREFAAATADIPAAKDWIAVSSIDEACDLVRGGKQLFEIILLAQPLPDQVRQADVDRLQHLVPLTRLVVVAGTWCEGELRSGFPPTGVIRLYWYELALWWRAALSRRDARLCPHWSLPLDHAQAGRCSVECHPATSTPLKATLLIETPAFANFDTLAIVLRAEGFACSHQRAAPPRLPQRFDPLRPLGPVRPHYAGGIWDGGQLGKEELQRLTDFCRQIPGRVIALLDFPRFEHIAQTRSAGAAGMLAKPYIAEELVTMLQGP